jgi:hypothetical protein
VGVRKTARGQGKWHALLDALCEEDGMFVNFVSIPMERISFAYNPHLRPPGEAFTEFIAHTEKSRDFHRDLPLKDDVLRANQRVRRLAA